MNRKIHCVNTILTQDVAFGDVADYDPALLEAISLHDVRYEMARTIDSNQALQSSSRIIRVAMAVSPNTTPDAEKFFTRIMFVASWGSTDAQPTRTMSACCGIGSPCGSIHCGQLAASHPRIDANVGHPEFAARVYKILRPRPAMRIGNGLLPATGGVSQNRT